ncbi:DNA-binding transcriptional regulator YbjK [Pantoea alhagi]|uniref:TetR/AcrR family transcriptional regulator n=1 Tax=Mixta sp. BE291 TaxID=3158787 RepID=UPI002867885A|nr:DNA-binding transcriptional regulator YbjK [Pantoea alhagi]
MTERSWRQDPQRRERIAEAALEVIVKYGVAGTTYRKVAAEAAVPLSAVSYYFSSLETLLFAAFNQLSQHISDRFSALIDQARTQQQAIDAVVAIIFGDATSSSRTLLLSYELYAFASRHPPLKPVMLEWMTRSRSALERHFSPAAAVAIDAFIEGMMIHRSVMPVAPESVAHAIRQLASL